MSKAQSFAKFSLSTTLLFLCIGCAENHHITIRVNTLTGKAELQVKNGDRVRWVDQDGNLLKPSDKIAGIHFKEVAPCKKKDKIEKNVLTDGVCHVSAPTTGHYVYDCGGQCADPDMPVQSNKKPVKSFIPYVPPPLPVKKVTANPCVGRTLLLQLPGTIGTAPATDTVAAGACILWESLVSTDITITNISPLPSGPDCKPSYTGENSEAGPCDLSGATSSTITYNFTQGGGTSNTGTITITPSGIANGASKIE